YTESGTFLLAVIGAGILQTLDIKVAFTRSAYICNHLLSSDLGTDQIGIGTAFKADLIASLHHGFCPGDIGAIGFTLTLGGTGADRQAIGAEACAYTSTAAFVFTV